MGSDLGLHGFLRSLPGTDPGTDAYAGDFGFKVLTAADPAEKTKKLNAEIAIGRLAMMATFGMFFQVGCGEKL